MSIRCLLLETTEKKRFFTLVKNKKNLGEYCRTFKAKMFLVRAEIEKSKILDLPDLVPALCDKNYSCEKVPFEVLEKVTPGKTSRTRGRCQKTS